MPCPYIRGRMERRVVTELVGRNAVALHDQLSLAGFRRSHGIVYAPACTGCQECIPVRIVVPGFSRSRSQRRIFNKNQDIQAEETSLIATTEQYQIFNEYQHTRHTSGDMAKMDFYEYQALIEESPIDTFLIEFRAADDRLLAVMLADRVVDGLSAVYSFFDPDESVRSLGTFMILWLIERARQQEMAHIYLGFWVQSSRKMAYKATFPPLEMYTPEGWTPLSRKQPPCR